MNLADVVKDYGFILPDDIRFDVAVLPELYHSINLLQKTTSGFNFVSRANPATPENNYGAVPSLDGDYISTYFPTEADKAAATAASRGDSSLPVLSEEEWNKFYSSVVWEAIDNYQGTPGYSESSVEPHRAFGDRAHLEIGSDYNATGIGSDRPWLRCDGVLFPGGGDASYGYPAIGGVPMILTPSVTFYVYCTIDADDHDPGHVISGPGVGEEDNVSNDSTYTFDPGNSAATFRKYAAIGSGTPDATGYLIGPQFGDNLVTGTENTFHYNDGTTDYTNQGYYPATMAIPQGPQTLEALSRAPESFYNWHMNELSGFVVQDKTAVLTWPFAYNGPIS